MRRIICDCLSGYYRTALTEDGEAVELIIERKDKKISAGSIYVGKIKRILPSQFMFIDLGDEKNSFLYLNDKKEDMLYKENEKTGKRELTVKQGDDIIVQVEKEATEIKGAVVTSSISIAGKYGVLLAGQKGIGISKKIENEERKRELKERITNIVPDECGLIIRTSCENAEIGEIEKEIKRLCKKYEEITKKGRYTLAPCEIYRDKNEIERAIRDFIENEDDEIIINDRDEYERLLEREEIKNIKYYDGGIPLFEYYGIERQLEKALHNKIWLKCGGFIIIERTEACNVIDVNTGKYTGKDHENTVLKTNMEAADEIARQIRLRNLSGMIIVDFIDMKREEDREKIAEIMRKAAGKDRIKTTIVGMTELGLMQITRKKTRKPIDEILLCGCPVCGGMGKIKNEDYVADKIRNSVISIFADTIYGEVTVSAGRKIIDAFEGKNRDYECIEKKYGKKIKTRVIETTRFDYYEIEKRV